MDLGIAGRTAIVCASSKGLGLACAIELARNGVNVVLNGRHADTLAKAEAQVRAAAPDVQVISVVADVTTAAGRSSLLAAASEPDILINNCGGPGAGDFRDWSEEVWIDALRANMISPILLMREVVDGMAARGFGRIVNITSRSVRTPLAGLGLSNGARAGLTGFVAGLSREMAPKNVIINNLLPGPFLTDRIRSSAAREAAATGRGTEDIINSRARAVPVGRLGRPEEFGVACAYFCSVHAEYIVGQNLLMDGGGFAVTV
jgi:3-oxoacyl-[acyl-carrier protein] reductase